MKQLLPFFLALSLVTPAFAGDKFFAFAAPNASTSPDGQYQIAVFGEHLANSQTAYNYYVAKFDRAGKIFPVSEPLRPYVGESPDLRGYGLSNVSWSTGVRNEERAFSEIVIVEVAHRKTQEVELLRRDADGTYRHLNFDISTYVSNGVNALWTELQAKGYIAGTDNAFLNYLSVNLGQGDPVRALGANFFLDEKVRLTYSASYSVVPKESSDRSATSAQVKIKLELDFSQLTLKVKELSNEVLFEEGN